MCYVLHVYSCKLSPDTTQHSGVAPSPMHTYTKLKKKQQQVNSNNEIYIARHGCTYL